MGAYVDRGREPRETRFEELELFGFEELELFGLVVVGAAVCEAEAKRDRRKRATPTPRPPKRP